MLAGLLWLAMSGALLAESVVLTTEERQWLLDHAQELTLAPTPNFQPLEFITETGEFSGFAGDMFHLMEKRLGIKFNLVYLPSWEAVVDAGKKKTIALTSLVQPTPEREGFWRFSSTYLEVPAVIIAGPSIRKTLGIHDLAGLRVGAVKAFAAIEYVKSFHPHLVVSEVVDDLTGLRKTALGELDVMISELPTAGYLIEKEGLSSLRLAGETGFTYRYSIGCRQDWPILHQVMQKALDSISLEERQTIYRRWIHLRVPDPPNYSPFFIAGAFLLTLLGSIWAWNRSLRSQVGHRTRELEAALRDVQSQERRLKESEEQFRKIFEIAPFAIAITRFPDGQYLQVNPALEKLTGYSAAELPGKSLVEILPPEANAAVPALHERLWRDGRVDGQMIAERSKDGALRHYLYSSALFLERGEQKVLTILVDMTETKRLEEELRQSQKMDVVGQLAGGISHDFNNMLTGIMGNTELLALKLPRGSPLLEFTSATLEASKRAADLTRKLLSFSRKGKLATAPLDIHVPLKATIGLLEASIDRRIRIISDFQAVGICIQGDNTLLQNVFLNLGVNSRDAMPEGGTLTFATSVVTLDEGACRNRFLPMAPGEYVEVKVCDTGVGIPRENLEKIFEPFFTTKEIGKGTGLGLATVYGAVREHGGGLSVTSEIGEGTTFRVFLPVHRLGPAGGEVRAEEPRMGSGRILVIEDESLIRLLVNTMLQRLGYEVVLAEDGQEGIEIFERELGRFDLVLSDVIMPRLNGRQVLVHLKERYPAVKVVFGSGFHDQETRDELMKLGALGFLQKPYDLAELSQIISQGLKARPPGHPRAKR